MVTYNQHLSILAHVREHNLQSVDKLGAELQSHQSLITGCTRNMSYSPAISDEAGAQIMEMIRPAVPSIDKLTPAARAKQAITLEPSPASTHGDSATDSSNPATPEDGRVRGQYLLPPYSTASLQRRLQSSKRIVA